MSVMRNYQISKKLRFKEMFTKHKIFVFYSILDLLFLLDKVRGDTDLSLLISDYNTFNQDICNSVIKEHPCVKNVLKILIDKIADIEKNQIKELRDQVSVLQEENMIKERRIYTFEDELKGIRENKKRSVSAQNFYSNDHSKTSSSIHDSLYSLVKTSNESNWINNNEESRKTDSWSTVRYSF